MNLSGIVVATQPARLAALVDRLNALPGVEVMQADAASGRIVLVQERESVGAEFDGLRAIQRLPHVLSADLVMHYFGDDPQPAATAIEEIAARLDAPHAPGPA